MRIQIKNGYVAVVSPKITWLCGLLSGSSELTRAAAFFPFIIFRSEDEKTPWVINHERIHLCQQLETAFVGFFLWSLVEAIYARFVLRKGTQESYLWMSSEQEAYRNQNDAQYLEKRPFWAQFRYVKDKRQFTFGTPGEIVFKQDSSDSNPL